MGNEDFFCEWRIEWRMGMEIMEVVGEVVEEWSVDCWEREKFETEEKMGGESFWSRWSRIYRRLVEDGEKIWVVDCRKFVIDWMVRLNQL